MSDALDGIAPEDTVRLPWSSSNWGVGVLEKTGELGCRGRLKRATRGFEVVEGGARCTHESRRTCHCNRRKLKGSNVVEGKASRQEQNSHKKSKDGAGMYQVQTWAGIQDLG